MTEIVVKELTVYPMKACQGVGVEEVEVTSQGLRGDRGFVMWSEGKLVDQLETPRCGSVSVSWNEEARTLALSHPQQGDYLHTARNEGDIRAAEWVLDKFETCDQGDEVAAWLSAAIDKPVRLVIAHEPWKKNLPLDQFELVHDQPTHRFYSASPVSLSNAASLEDLNDKLESPVPMDRFRMNVVVEGLPAWAEDDIVSVASDAMTLRRVTHCERCAITTTDQQTGERTKSDLLQVLRKHRFRDRDEGRFGSGLLFGAYMAVEREGTLRVGDRLEVELRQEPAR